MATTSLEELRTRAVALDVGEVVECASVVGGGSAPGTEIASVGVALSGDQTAVLRGFDPPVIARVHDARTVVDLRTVDPGDDPTLAKALRTCT
jgi:L-seryl-tRNA(Ser) seleniumtransferase